jgi:hypothetical protein
MPQRSDYMKFSSSASPPPFLRIARERGCFTNQRHSMTQRLALVNRVGSVAPTRREGPIRCWGLIVRACVGRNRGSEIVQEGGHLRSQSLTV